MSFKYTLSFIIISICAVGCKNNQEMEARNHEIEAVKPAQEAVKGSDALQKTQTAQTPAETPKPVVKLTEDNKNGWYFVRKDADGNDILRCFDYRGCFISSGKKYMLGTEKLGERVFCGVKDGYEYVEGMHCDRFTSVPVCDTARCDCGKNYIAIDEYCVDGRGNYGYGEELKRALEAQPELDDEEDNNIKSKIKPYVRTCPPTFNDIDVPSYDFGDYAEFKCLWFEKFNHDLWDDGVWYCDKPKGCRTKDGRIYHFASIIKIDQNGNIDTDCEACTDKNSGLCGYYISGTKDTTRETLCKTGDCVIEPEADPDLRIVNWTSYSRVPAGFEKGATGEVDGRFEASDGDLRYVEIQGTTLDTSTCAGGKRYCHGRDSAPIAAPQADKGYVCEAIDEASNAKVWVCKDGPCVCGGEACPAGAYCSNENCMCDQMSYREMGEAGFECLDGKPVCKKDACLCGADMVPTNAVCARGNQAMCKRANASELGKPVYEPKPGAGAWACSERGWTCNSTDAASTCMGCGEGSCASNAVCAAGECVCGPKNETRPVGAYRCDQDGWTCRAKSCLCYGDTIVQNAVCHTPSCSKGLELTQDGCMAGTTRIPHNYNSWIDYIWMQKTDGLGVFVCEKTQCKCGEIIINHGMYCENGQGITPKYEDGEPSKLYILEATYKKLKAVEECQADTCVCGEQTCSQYQFCDAGDCIDGALRLDVGGKTLQYALEGNDHFNDYSDNIEDDSSVDTMRTLERVMYGDYKYCGDDWSALTSPIGDTFDGFVCSFDYENCHDENCLEEPTGWVCSQDTCRCGQKLVSRHSSCKCEVVEGKLSCQTDSKYGIDLTEAGEQICYDSYLKDPENDRYTCKPDLGYVCMRKHGCKCGANLCAMGAICLPNDVCTAVAIKRTESI